MVQLSKPPPNMPLFIDEDLSPVEKGRTRYKEKDYVGALEAFAEAVRGSSGNLRFTALDMRAATYEKLEQLQNALRDAKGMIDMKPDMAKGYLRCAKVLQLKGEKELALKIYERGLTKVKIGTDDNRTALQAMFNKLRYALNPGKTRDPLEYLPLELAQIVIEHLEMRDRIICLAVTKSWKKLLESSHKLWTIFDTSRARKPVGQNSLKQHLRRSNYTLNTAIISSRSHFDAGKLTYLTKTCKKLRQLEFNGTGIIGDSLIAALPFAKTLTSITVSVNYEISLSTIMRILVICQKTLVHAVFRAVKGSGLSRFASDGLQLNSLRVLQLDSVLSTTPSVLNISQLHLIAPNLESVSCNGWIMPGPCDLSNCIRLENVEFGKVSMSQMPILPPSIKHLNINNNPLLTKIASEAEQLDVMPCELSLLESFNCEGTNLNGEDLKFITTSSIKAGNLKHLFVGSRFTNDDNTTIVEDEYPASQTVEELSLAHIYIPEKRIISIVGLYPNLQKLDVSYTKVTGVAVKHFLEMGIKKLRVNECPEISPDAIEYARGRGVQVEFNFPSRRLGKSFRDRLS